MTYKKYILIIAVVALGTVAGCKKFLERTPAGQLTKEEAIKNEQDLQAFMNGVYGYLGDGDYFGGRLQTLNELLGDELKGDRFTGDFAEIFKRQSSFFGG